MNLYTQNMFKKIALNSLLYAFYSLQLNTWHHIAAVKDGSTRRLYVGGTDTEVSLTITDINGVVIERRTVRVPASRIYSMNMSRYREGLYLLHAKSSTLDKQIKVIKR